MCGGSSLFVRLGVRLCPLRHSTEQDAEEGDAKALLEERIEDGIDGRVHPQQPEDGVERSVGNAEIADRIDKSADLERSPRDQKDDDEDGQ